MHYTEVNPRQLWTERTETVILFQLINFVCPINYEAKARKETKTYPETIFLYYSNVHLEMVLKRSNSRVLLIA